MPAPGPRVQPDRSRIVVRVRVWYADGTVLEGADWSAHPADGVQAVRLGYADGTGRHMYGDDWYFQAKGNADQVYGAAAEEPDPGRYDELVTLRGKWTDDATFAAIEQQVLDG